MNLNKRTLATAGVLAAIVVGGGASVAAAAGGGAAPAPTSSVGVTADAQQADGETSDGPDGGAGSGGESSDPGYVGSVAAPADTRPDGQETAAGDAQEGAALQSLATITSPQAEQAALAAVPGTAAQTQLDNENGFVVYSVEVTGADGTVTEVKVDAGNGTVLDQQVGGDGETAGGTEQPGSAGDIPD